MYSFDEIKGNELIVTSLKNAVLHNKVSHSYIFTGSQGCGKKLMANSFAKTLLCEEGGLFSCNQCVSCRSFESGNNPDMIYVKPQKTISIGVDDIREQVISTVNIKPYQYKYKIYMIENADLMTAQAQNAILKTIEEPPFYSVFLLLASNLNDFLQTILSRCVIKKIPPLNKSTVSAFLIEKGETEENALVYGNLSGGSIGKALKLSSNETFNVLREDVIKVLTNLKTGSIKSIFENANQIIKHKDSIGEALDIMETFLRDALIYKTTNTEKLHVNDYMMKIDNFIKDISTRQIIASIDAVEEAMDHFSHNANFNLTVEVMFMKMAGL